MIYESFTLKNNVFSLFTDISSGEEEQFYNLKKQILTHSDMNGCVMLLS